MSNIRTDLRWGNDPGGIFEWDQRDYSGDEVEPGTYVVFGASHAGPADDPAQAFIGTEEATLTIR